jgi:hypothetical protein
MLLSGFKDAPCHSIQPALKNPAHSTLPGIKEHKCINPLM